MNECTSQPVRIRPSGAGAPSPFPVPSLHCQTGLVRYLVSGFPVGTVLRASEPMSLATHSIKWCSCVCFGLRSDQILLLGA